MATIRSVPLTTGVVTDQSWPSQQFGSSTSMTNWWPLGNGALTPRSRLSSLNTVNAPGISDIVGMTGFTYTNYATSDLWCSATTNHGVLHSNGSISRASFVSAFGLGVSGLPQQNQWQYAQTYDAVIDENIILAVGQTSPNTILALYRTNGAANGAPLFSYLTGAPKALAVGVFDNYVLAGALQEASLGLAQRIRWCQRGNSSAWTAEGSGFEDLLEMRGKITAIKPSTDARVLVFGNRQIWYGVAAPYPQQFQFFCQESEVGCPYPSTIASTDAGYIFLGSDLALRLLPAGGGASVIIAPSLSPLLRNLVTVTTSAPKTWGLFDPERRIYHMFIDPVNGLGPKGLVINTVTGEWGYADYNFGARPATGCVIPRDDSFYPGGEGIYFGNSAGTIYSTSSILGIENGSNVTAAWRSAPIAADMPGNYKLITQADLDYRSTTSGASLRLKVSQDGGESYESGGRIVSLPIARMAGRATSHMHIGAAFPTIELTSQSTGFELHRIDVTLTPNGRR